MMTSEAAILAELPRLRGFLARRLGGEAADDALQEAMLAGLQGRGRLRDGAQLRSWLLGVAHHKAMDELRGWYRREARHAAYERERPRVAPSARRRAISFDRAEPRARSMLARLRLAIRRTQPAMPRRVAASGKPELSPLGVVLML